MQPPTSGFAGGSLAASERGQAEIFGQELASADTEPGDVPALQRQVGRLTTVSNADKLMALVGGAKPVAGPAPAAPSDNASKLLAMVAGPAAPAGPPITGDPNADPRDIRMNAKGAASNAADQARNNGWLSTAMRNMPSPTAAGRNAQQGGAGMLSAKNFPTLARGIVTGVGGIPGNMEDALVHKLPKALGFEGDTGTLPDGSSTFFPTSKDVGEGLAHIGWKADKSRADVEESGDSIGGTVVLPAGLDAGIVGEGSRAVKKGLVNYAENGGKASQEMRSLASRISGEGATAAGERAAQAERIVGETPMPEVRAPQPMPPVKPTPVGDLGASVPPVPNRAKLADNLGSSKGAPTALSDISGDFEKAVAGHTESLQSQKRAVWQEFQDSLGDQKMVDLSGLKDKLQAGMENAGTKATRDSYASLLNDINHVEANSKTPVEAVQEIRRQLSQAAKFGQETTGYAAIKASDAKDFSKELGGALREGHEAYGPFADRYRELSKASEPAASRFLKSVGEKEATGDLMTSAMRNPKNIETAIAAMGGDTKAFDTMATKFIANQIKGKSGETLNDFVRETAPKLRNLPEAQAAMASFVQRTQMTEGLEDIAKAAEEAMTSRSKAIMDAQKAADKATETIGKQSTATALARQRGAEAAHTTAQKASEEAKQVAQNYRADLTSLQLKPAAEQASTLDSMTKRMLKDGLIDESKYNAFAQQIADAKKAVDKEKAFRNLAKYVTYALTGNYLVSFGGPAALAYVSHK